MFMKWLTAKNKGSEYVGPNSGTLDPSDMIKSTNRTSHVKVTFGKRDVLRRKLFSDSSKPPAVESGSGKKTDHAPARGVLSAHRAAIVLNPLRLFHSIPTVRKFLPFVVPVTTTSIGRVSGYLTMSHVASSALGTLDLAAHQIAVSIFCCLAPVVDALNQVAQSFVPSIFAREKGRARAVALRRTSINFARVGAFFGLAVAALVVAGVPVLGNCFTSDPEVLSRVRQAVPGIAVFLGFDGLMCIGEGTLLGQKDLRFLRNAYASFFFLVPALMLRLKRRALNGIEVGIGTMWGTFSIYEVVRTIMWLGRVVWLQRKTEREVEIDGY
jgi:Na+-driven multidrug efflux pump